MESTLQFLKLAAELIPGVATLLHALLDGDPATQQRVKDILPPRSVVAEIEAAPE